MPCKLSCEIYEILDLLKALKTHKMAHIICIVLMHTKYTLSRKRNCKMHRTIDVISDC